MKKAIKTLLITTLLVLSLNICAFAAPQYEEENDNAVDVIEQNEDLREFYTESLDDLQRTIPGDYTIIDSNFYNFSNGQAANIYVNNNKKQNIYAYCYVYDNDSDYYLATLYKGNTALVTSLGVTGNSDADVAMIYTNAAAGTYRVNFLPVNAPSAEGTALVILCAKK